MKFLDHKALGREIKNLMRGSEVRCAVAFWGDDAVSRLFGTAAPCDEARIICDISMGATNPRELVALGAPSNSHLRHIPKLHAKVYISSRGAIVCSANASDNGIGFTSVAGLLEAGVLLDLDTEASTKLQKWFEQLWTKSQIVGTEELARATDAWNSRPKARTPRRASNIPSDGPSLFATVAADPERFRGIGFAFTTGSASNKARSAAVEELETRDLKSPRAQRLTRAEKARLKAWPTVDLFTGWSLEDLNAWPRQFVCIHRPRSLARYYFYQRVHGVMTEQEDGVIFAERPTGLSKDLGFSQLDQMQKIDASLLTRLFKGIENDGHRLFESGDRLLQFVEDVE